MNFFYFRITAKIEADMIEIPEAVTLSKQIEATVLQKTITNVIVNTSPHKFAFFFDDPARYPDRLFHKKFLKAEAIAGFVQISCDNLRLLFNDGVNIRYLAEGNPVPQKHQLHIQLEDHSSIVCTVQMYGGLWLFQDGENESPYYITAMEKPSPLSDAFDFTYFQKILHNTKQTLSAKAFLATEQRIPGLGNGCLQDILFNAQVNPRTKIENLSAADIERLYTSLKTTLREMTELGGRNTEKDLFGQSGRYQTRLSSLTFQNPCPNCGNQIIKQAYLGGSVYFCPTCQPEV